MNSPGCVVAFFDVDNTLIRGSSLYFMGRGMYQRGYFTKKEISAFVLANLRYRLTGKENPREIQRYQDAATDFIGGHSVETIKALGSEIYDEYVSPKLWHGTIEIARQHLARGEEVWLVTAAPEDLANLIAQRLGFTGALGTIAETADGKYTGRIIGGLLHAGAKATAVRELAERHGIDLEKSFAYSDSHHDLPLLESVGNPCAINPDALLQIRALKEGWPIYDYRRMKSLTKFLGPTIGRAAALGTYFSPRNRGEKKRKELE